MNKIKLKITTQQLQEVNEIFELVKPKPSQNKFDKMSMDVWNLLSIKFAKKLIDKKFEALQKEHTISFKYWEAFYLELFFKNASDCINPEDHYKINVATALYNELNQKLA